MLSVSEWVAEGVGGGGFWGRLLLLFCIPGDGMVGGTLGGGIAGGDSEGRVGC